MRTKIKGNLAQKGKTQVQKNPTKVQRNGKVSSDIRRRINAQQRESNDE